MSIEQQSRDQLRYFSTVAEAQQGAIDDAAATGGRLFPCVVFNQGALTAHDTTRG